MTGIVRNLTFDGGPGIWIDPSDRFILALDENPDRWSLAGRLYRLRTDVDSDRPMLHEGGKVS